MMLSSFTTFRRDEVSSLQLLFGMMDDRLKNERLLEAKIFENLGNAQRGFLLELTEISVHRDCVFIQENINSSPPHGPQQPIRN